MHAFELAFANAVTQWQQDEATHAEALDAAMRYAAWASHTPAGKAAHRGGVLFRAPRKLDMYRLVPAEQVALNGVNALQIASTHGLRRRDGFALTDPGSDLVGALDQAHYCIWCHEQGKDSCARGLPEKRVIPKTVRVQEGGGEKPVDATSPRADVAAAEIVPFKQSVFGVTLAGCPLEEKSPSSTSCERRDGRSARSR